MIPPSPSSSDVCCCVQLGREVLDIAARTVGVGVTTEEVDRAVHEVSFSPHDLTLYSPCHDWSRRPALNVTATLLLSITSISPNPVART